MNQNQQPTVAVIIPTIGRPEFVKGAIETACEQTYEAIEILVVDGSDNKETEAVVNQIRQRYEDVQITHIHNDEPKGLPAARNQACSETIATYLAFLDDDDRWEPTGLSS